MMKSYPLVDDLLRPLLRVAMPRAGRLYALGGTVHVVARCNNREFYFTTPADFEVLLAHLREMIRTYALTLYACTLISNHLHLLLQAPKLDALGRPLRWLMTETAKTFHRLRGRRGHFWERRYRAYLGDDPATYPWSSCAAYALGTPSRLITFHPSYLALSPYPKVRQRQYRPLLLPSADPRLDARNPRWTRQRAVGCAAFLTRYLPPRGRRRSVPVPPQIQALGA